MEIKQTQNKNTVYVRLSWLIPWIFGWLFTYGYVGFAHDYTTWSTGKILLDLMVSFFFYPIILGWKLSGRVGLFN